MAKRKQIHLVKAPKMPKVARDYLCNLFKDNKITKVVIDFSGEGDDGSINNVSFYPEKLDLVSKDEVVVPDEVVECLETNSFSDGRLKKSEAFSLEEIVVFFVEHWIYDECGVDWVNGDGGEGECVLELKKNNLHITISASEFIRDLGPEFVCEI